MSLFTRTLMACILGLLTCTTPNLNAGQPPQSLGNAPAPVPPEIHPHPHGWRLHHRHGIGRQYWQPGGYEGRIGSPYYWSVPATSWGGYHHGHHWGDSHQAGCGCGHSAGHGFLGHGSQFHNRPSFHGADYGWTEHWRGSRRYFSDPYSYHFGPGYYRHYEHGHFRFPYYSYRRPWYYPGQPVFNRDTNFAW